MAPSSGPTAAKPDPPVIPPSDLVSSLPAPVVRLLVTFARPIAYLRITIEVLCWKNGRRVESWMVVAGWWAICLGSRHAFKLVEQPLKTQEKIGAMWKQGRSIHATVISDKLQISSGDFVVAGIAIFLPLLPLDHLRLPYVSQNTKTALQPRSFTSTALQPTNHESLLRTLSDLHAIQALLPASPSAYIVDTYSRFSNLGQLRLIRGFIIIWSTWVILGHYITGFRALLAILGTVILLQPSPSFAQTINLLSKSLLARRTLALLFLLTFGSPPEQSIKFDLSFSVSDWVRSKWAASRRPSLAISFRPKMDKPTKVDDSVIEDEAEAVDQPGEAIYFRFEVHENQRWWMGLDWTSALLPQERPSWCDSHLLPVSPPPSFPLPPSSSIILPSPTPADPHGQVKRTATWKWLDDDWSIVRTGPGQPHNTSPAFASSSTIPQPLSTSTTKEKEPEGYMMASSPPKLTGSQIGSVSGGEEMLSAGARAQSLAEQAFTKGLERLKARTTNQPVPNKPSLASPRSSMDIKRDRRQSASGADLLDTDEAPPPGASSGAGAAASAGGVTVFAGGETLCERDDATDMDGWVYGDNKWENMGPKGGLGRVSCSLSDTAIIWVLTFPGFRAKLTIQFTRRRRWQRRAVCTETVQRISSESPSRVPSATSPAPVSAAPAGSSTIKPSSPVTSTLKAKPVVSTDPRQAITTANSASPSRPIQSGSVFGSTTSPGFGRRQSTSTDEASLLDEMGHDRGLLISSPGGVSNVGISGNGRDDVLRQRLKKAMGNVGG